MIAPFVSEGPESEEADPPELPEAPVGRMLAFDLTYGRWVPIERAKISATDPTFMGVQTGKARIPIDSPGLARLYSDGKPLCGPDSPHIKFQIDGQTVLDGYIAEPSADQLDGFISLDCYAGLGHADHGINGDAHTNVIGLGSTHDRMFLGDGYYGWLPLGCNVTSTVLTAGPKRSLTLDEKTWIVRNIDPRQGLYRSIHINANVGTSLGKRTYTTSAWLRIESSVKYPATIKARTVVYYLDVDSVTANRQKIVLDWQLPDDLPLGEWIYCEGPEITVPEYRNAQIRTGLWTARGGGHVTWSTVDLVEDVGLSVPNDASAAEYVRQLFNAAFQDTKAQIPVYKLSESDLTFPDGKRIAFKDHDSFTGIIREYDSDVSWFHDSRTNVLYVGGTTNFGDRRPEIVFGNDESAGGHKIVGFGVPTDDEANSQLLALSDGSGTRYEWRDTREANYRWTNYTSADAGTLPKDLPALAEKMRTAMGTARTQLKVQLATPPNGRCPADWLINGRGWRRLKPGDRPLFRFVYGPHDEGGECIVEHLEADWETGGCAATVRVK